MNSRQPVMPHLVSRDPSVFALLVFPSASLVCCFACSTKGGGIAVAFVLVHVLSWCYLACVGRLLQHGGMRQGIVCSCGCQEEFSR